MKILGVHPTHTATAALVEDGKILSVISEERMNKIKESYGLPVKATRKIMEINKTKSEEIDLVVINAYTTPTLPTAFKKESFSIYMSAFNFFKDALPHKLVKKNWWVKPAVNLSHNLRNKKELYSYFESIGIPQHKIIFADHHLLHAYTCFLNTWGQTDDMLILTLDGAGDGLSGTVNVVKNGKFKVIEKMNLYNSLGFLYSRITQYLNMKPNSHEYKVMGLAAYSKDKEAERVYQILRKNFMNIDRDNPLRLENLSGAVNWDYLDKLDEYFADTRFDHLAGGAQKLVEELVHDWVMNCVKKTGIKNVFCSGGVFMNVKANMKLAYEKEIDRLFVFPSCGDESCAIGASYFGYKVLCDKNKVKFNPEKLKDLYLGSDFTEQEILDAINKNKDKVQFKKIKDINKFVASLLAKGEVVARCSGKMEFGARALGNRSILAHPNKLGVVREINEAIKQRDFWMPFACTILDKYEEEYIVNPNKVPANYMIFSFMTKEKAHTDLINGMHQYDLTARPQILKKEHNPDYYEVIENFKKLTGIGGLLNTSFNIHGEPIVLGPEEAISTLLRSGLKNLVVGNYYITKS